ncbi:universal stress protein [Fulvimarina endophytica]|uniref:Universal stress protein n=1 Tax=Fulvimarina endophytica TaxID=2293836 RepID=A0A371X1C8_9HYPH|nr:universal stress protein [Fulvimarina endophytica]RFC62834.1 universal stress protein [Fulvimarina endophytica]
MTKVLGLIDGSQHYTPSVVDHLAFAAKALGARAELIHVIGRRDIGSAPADLSGSLDLGARDELLRDLAAHDEQRAKLARKRGHVILSDAAQKLRESGLQDVGEELVLGDLLEAVEKREQGAELLVIGKRGEAADFARMHLGSNVDRIMRHAHVPVLVASRAFRPIEKILVAYDGGQSILKAVDFLRRSPLLKGRQIEIVQASTNSSSSDLERLRADFEASGFEASCKMLQGEPEDAIASECERSDIDLVVVGASGHSRLRAFFVGSTANEIVRKCMRPVLLFR